MKMFSKLGLTALAGALVLALAACSTSTPLDSETAAALAPLAADTALDQMAYMTNPGDLGLGLASTTASSQSAFLRPLGLSPQQTGSCTATYSGEVTNNEPTDNDFDDIPANATASYDCHWEDEFGTYDLTGSITLDDHDDNDAASGYSMTVDNVESSATSGGETVTLGFDGSYELNVNGSNYTADLNLDLILAIGGEAGRVSYDFTQEYVAADDGDDIHFDNGTLDFSGTFSVSIGGESYSLTTTGTDLVWNGSSFERGTVTFTDTAGNDLVVTFSGGSYSATFNNDPLS